MAATGIVGFFALRLGAVSLLRVGRARDWASANVEGTGVDVLEFRPLLVPDSCESAGRPSMSSRLLPASTGVRLLSS